MSVAKVSEISATSNKSFEDALQQAVARQPVEPLAFRYLADSSERVGHAAAAHDALTRYVALVDEDDLDPATPARLARLERRR